MDEPLGNPEPDWGALWQVLERAGVPAATLDPAASVRSANSAFAQAWGRTEGELVDATLIGLTLADDRSRLRDAMGLLAAGDHTVADLTLRVVGVDGTVRVLQLHLGRVGPHLLCIARDRTNERRRERSDRRRRVEAAHRATTDPGSGLPNRRGLELLLASAARRAGREGSAFAVLHCVLSVPDDHPAGVDTVVPVCLERMRQRLRSADSITRADRDVLVVVAEDLHDEQDAAGVAYRLLSSAVEPVPGEGGDLGVDMRVGIAVGDATAPVDTLLAVAAEAAGTAERGGFRILDRREEDGPA